jgi:hypothetical protein
MTESAMETTIGEARGGVPTRRRQGQWALITGGTRGLGHAMVKSLVSRGARVTVLARHRAGLGDVARMGADGMQGGATDAALMDGLGADLKPAVLILNAGATPHMSSIDEQSFDSFSVVWNTDVKAALNGVQAALKAPMPDGGRVLLVSSGAAMVLSLPAIRPEAMRLSGKYIGAKRVIWRWRTTPAASRRSGGSTFISRCSCRCNSWATPFWGAPSRPPMPNVTAPQSKII